MNPQKIAKDASNFGQIGGISPIWSHWLCSTPWYFCKTDLTVTDRAVTKA